MKQIEPKTLKGFRDSLPETEIPRQKMIAKIRASYETFGFEPLETPALEYAEILTGKYGEEGDKLMYQFKDNGDRDVAMRYDLTIPLARVAAQYQSDLKRPFKRYQISPVWRADNPQKGRYREFYQCDADIVGTESPLADAEILALSSKTLQSLGIKADEAVIRANSREIIAAFYDSLGFSAAEQVAIMRTVDKMDKIGAEGVAEELGRLNLSNDAVKSIVEFAETRIDDVEEIDAALGSSPAIKAPLEKLVGIVRSALALAPKANIVIDLSIARGLDYYTGLIFETSLVKAPQFGSILSGGRYDGLVGMFSNKPVPAVGASIGLDRLFAALEELKLVKKEKATAKVLVVNFDEALTDEYLKIVSTLRDAGIPAILYFDTADLKKQLSYASDKGIRYAIMYGSNEAKEGKAVVKDLEKGTQSSIKLAELAQSLLK